MKARVKATGEELEVHLVDKQARYIGSDGVTYWEEDLDFGIENDNTPDYWTRLEHQYAGMAMHGMLNNSLLIASLLKVNKSHEDIVAEVTGTAIRYSRALVEKYKKEERK